MSTAEKPLPKYHQIVLSDKAYKMLNYGFSIWTGQMMAVHSPDAEGRTVGKMMVLQFDLLSKAMFGLPNGPDSLWIELNSEVIEQLGTRDVPPALAEDEQDL